MHRRAIGSTMAKGQMMTRKDYVLIAAAIKEQVNWFKNIDGKCQLSGIYEVAGQIAVALKRDNSAFDYQRFMRACGFED